MKQTENAPQTATPSTALPNGEVAGSASSPVRKRSRRRRLPAW